jgi:hypothetical protein
MVSATLGCRSRQPAKQADQWLTDGWQPHAEPDRADMAGSRLAGRPDHGVEFSQGTVHMPH